ncbi:MAG: alpha/beta fold hydrolase [Pseudomonadota bacterium]
MSTRYRSDSDAIRKLDRVPAKLVRGLRALNAFLLPPERLRSTLHMGLSVVEEAYFVGKNLIDGTIHVSEKVLYDEDYHRRRLEAFQGQRRLVVFVPGYMQLASGFQRLERYLGIDVFDAFTYIYGDFPYSQDIQLSAQQLEARLRQIQQQLHADEIYLVGHSQGGIIIRTLVQHGLASELPITKCLFLSSPHRGTWVGLAAIPHKGLRKAIGLLPYARQVRGESGLQLLPGSDFLTALNAMPLPPQIQFASVHYNFDPMILPPENAELPYREAQNFFINKVGHAQPLYCSRATEIAIRFLYGNDAEVRGVSRGHVARPRRDRS